jgi:hypothetical protein
VSTRPFERALLGVLAGVAATMAMTATMKRLHTMLPDDEQYPLPPREVVDRTVPAVDERQARSRTMLAHFGFGGLTGALFALVPAIRSSYRLGSDAFKVAQGNGRRGRRGVRVVRQTADGAGRASGEKTAMSIHCDQSFVCNPAGRPGSVPFPAAH